MITAEDVEQVLFDCFVETDKDEHVQKGLSEGRYIHINGVIQNFILRKDKLKEHEEQIREFLSEMSDEYFMDKGKGWTFLNMCLDRHGRQWGEHVHMEMLVVLGIGIGCVHYILERGFWFILPGSMPYIAIDLSKRMGE